MARSIRISATITLAITAIALLSGATTVDTANKYAWMPNAGWINWQGNTANGAVFTNHFASGYIWSANVGWIFLGDGSPKNGVHYSNTQNGDTGVNVDPTADSTLYILKGYAWSGNVGWINFESVGNTVGSASQPRIDKTTLTLKGYAWAPNAGWIALESPGKAIVKTTINAVTESKMWYLY